MGLPEGFSLGSNPCRFSFGSLTGRFSLGKLALELGLAGSDLINEGLLGQLLSLSKLGRLFGSDFSGLSGGGCLLSGNLISLSV